MKINRIIGQPFEFLGLRFYDFTLIEAIHEIERFIEARSGGMVFSLAAELIVRASRDPALRKVYLESDLLTADGYVVYYAARLFRKPIREPVSAARLMQSFLGVAEQKGYSIYLVGATESVLQQAVNNLRHQFPRLQIAGYHNGYFKDSEQDVVSHIMQKAPDVLFVGMSSPMKEHFISGNRERMKVPVAIGVGGYLDIIAGKCRLAPPWISRLGIEWLYRLVQEPKRLWKRYLITNMQFIILLLRDAFRPRTSRFGQHPVL